MTGPLEAPRPLISVLVPAFDYGHYLRECLESVLAQTVTDLEVVVADNASRDATAEIAAEFAARDARVAWFRHAENVGYARNFNSLLERARGTYLTVLGSDDRYVEPDFLECASGRLAAEPDVAFFHSAYLEVDTSGAAMRTVRYHDRERVDARHDALSSLLGLRYPWISSVVVPRELVRRVGGFDLEFEYAWDLAWFWKLALAGDVAYSPRAFVTYRRHTASLSGSQDDTYKRRHVLAALERFRPRLANEPALLAACDRSRDVLRDRLQEGAPAEHPLPHTRLAARLADWRASGVRVLIYGAGMHTRQLWEQHDFGGVQLVGLADRDPAYRGETFQGLPIVGPQEIESTGAEVVLVSSRFYEGDIVRALTASLPQTIGIQRLYGLEPAASGTTSA